MQNGQHSSSQHSESTPPNCRRGADKLQHEKAETLALWSIAVTQFHGTRPGLDRLLFEEFGQQGQVLLLVIRAVGMILARIYFVLQMGLASFAFENLTVLVLLVWALATYCRIEKKIA